VHSGAAYRGNTAICTICPALHVHAWRAERVESQGGLARSEA
jgi:hypothetical protein